MYNPQAPAHFARLFAHNMTEIHQQVHVGLYGTRPINMSLIRGPRIKGPVPLYELEQEVCRIAKKFNFLAVLDHSALAHNYS